MHNGFASLKEIFDAEPGFENLRRVVKQSDVVNDFGKILPELKKVATAVKVEKKALCLRVENPAWRSELKFRENEIIEKVNNFYKEKRIMFVRFVR
ncbi:MAG TPA: DUF721 domain-containing protein [Ignavibacteriaceae bacterium]|nr:DUF721 domain-containing protein [Ignavibacteriaceae bacterium]